MAILRAQSPERPKGGDILGDQAVENLISTGDEEKRGVCYRAPDNSGPGDSVFDRDASPAGRAEI